MNTHKTTSDGTNTMAYYRPKPQMKNGVFVKKTELKPSDFVLVRTLKEIIDDPTTMDKILAEYGKADNKTNLIGQKFGKYLEVVALSDHNMEWLCYCHNCFRKQSFTVAKLRKNPSCGCEYYKSATNPLKQMEV